MSLKKKEFHNLKQRHLSVAEYIEEFNNLARYAPDEVDTDAKRKEKFLEGLNDELNLQLDVAYVPTYQSLCDKATILENKMNQVENRKRKHKLKNHPGSSKKKHSFKKSNEDSEPHQYHHNSNGVRLMEMILTMEMTLVRTNMTLSGRKTLASCNAIIVRNLDTMHQTILRRKRTRMLEEPMEMTPM